MKKNSLKIVFILISALALISVLITNVNAEATWDGENNVLTIPCGDTVTSVNLGDEGLNCVDVTGIVHNADRYEIIENTGTSILTGWTNAIWNNNNSSYYGTMNVNTSEVGQQVLTIRFTPGNGSTDPSQKTTEFVVKCTASDDLKTVLEALGCVLEDGNASINSDNAYTSLDDLTGDQYEAILDSEDAYNALNDAEKAIADALMAEKLNMTAEEVLQAADDGIERLADEFVAETRLNDENVNFENLEEAREILVNATTLGEEFDALSPRTQERVLAKLSDDDYQFESWDEVSEVCQELIDLIDATLFITNYIEVTDDGINEEKVLAGEDPWNNLNDNAKELANEMLESIEGIEKTYPELLVRAKANKFLSDDLTKDEKVIVEANNSNYKQILDAEEDYNELSDEVKEEVNSILTELGNTTYPELLKYAQQLEPTPKTGDIAVIMIVALVVSILGLGITFIKRK